VSISSFGAAGVKPGVVTSTTRPTTPYLGMVIFETDTGYLRVWDGSAWDYLSQSQGTTTNIKASDIGGVWSTWTPTLTAATTNPNLGSTGTSTGRYGRIQNLVYGWAQFQFGGTGISAGSGSYFCSIPVTAKEAGPVVGSAWAVDISTYATHTGVVLLDSTTRLISIGTGGGVYAAAINSSTFVWAASDIIRFGFTYEAA
jgi:hypothetical protein